jgi:hypothetical protein
MLAHTLKPSLKLTDSRSDARLLSIGSEMDYSSQDPEDQEGVELLLGIATIVSNEIASSKNQIFDDDDDDDDDDYDYKRSFRQPTVVFDDSLTPRTSTGPPSSLIKDDMFAWHRIRTVSIDSTPRTTTDTNNQLAIVSPVGIRGLRTIRKPSLKLLANKGKKKQIKFPKLIQTQTQTQSNNQTLLPNVMSEHKRKAMEQRTIKGKSITMIHRKKFSWKNYPGEIVL